MKPRSVNYCSVAERDADGQLISDHTAIDSQITR
jgi:hypothetical protein